jgi:hypothetical protein
MRRVWLAAGFWLALAGPVAAQQVEQSPPIAPWRIWARVEYLLWWVRDDHAAVPLVTTGPAGASRSGALGEPSTSVLVGPNLDYRLNSGGKLWLGGWFDSNAVLGVEVTGFCLETHTTHEKAYSNRTTGAPVIARPFLNTLTGLSDAQIITTPADALGGRYFGGIGIFGDSRTWGGEANLLLNVICAAQSRWELVGGFRYLGQKDQLRSDQSSTVLAPGTVGFAGQPAPVPDIVSLRDYLETTNNFYGGQLGIQGRMVTGPFTLDLGAKVGLGCTEEHLEALGRTLLTNPGGVTLYQAGGLFVPATVSSMDRARVAFVSEVNLRLGYRITERWTASVGYTFLYWNDVIRPAGQINPAVDPRQLPTSLYFNPAASPAAFALHSTDFWAQGLTVGLEFRY